MPPKMLVGRQDCLHKIWVGRLDRRYKILAILPASEIANILCKQSCLPTNIFGGISAASSRGVNDIYEKMSIEYCPVVADFS